MSSALARLFSAAAKDYDAARRQLVPCFDAFYATVLERLAASFSRKAAIRVLDLGAGTGLLSALVAQEFPEASFVLADISPDMLAKARERLGERSARRFVLLDLASDPLPEGPFDAVISALAIHHLEDGAKRALFARIFGVLRPGGVFLNADQAAADQSQRESWLAATRAAGVSEAALAAALERMREDRDAPFDEQLRWLREAGFQAADLFFKQWFFVVYGGRRP